MLCAALGKGKWMWVIAFQITSQGYLPFYLAQINIYVLMYT